MMSSAERVPDQVKADDAPKTRMNPDAALKRLQEGNARYAANAPSVRDYSAGRAERAAAQYPFAAVLSCADSRVAPELAFDQGPGDLFVVRLAGNFVNTDGLASLEYGVEFLGASLILVLGHTHCGAVDAAIKVLDQKVELPGQLPCLIGSIKPVVEPLLSDPPHDLLQAAMIENVRANVKRLEEAGPILAPRVVKGEIRVVGGYYDLHTGKVEMV